MNASIFFLPLLILRTSAQPPTLGVDARSAIRVITPNLPTSNDLVLSIKRNGSEVATTPLTSPLSTLPVQLRNEAASVQLSERPSGCPVIEREICINSPVGALWTHCF